MALKLSKTLSVAALLTLLLVAFGMQSALADVCQVPNCTTCTASSVFKCAECKSGYISADGQCAPQGTCGVTHCKTCAANSISRCSVCDSGYTVTGQGLCGKPVTSAASTTQVSGALLATAAAVYASAVIA